MTSSPTAARTTFAAGLFSLLAVLGGCEDDDVYPPPSVAREEPVIAEGLERARAEGWDPRFDALLPVDAAPQWVTVATVYGLSLGLPIAFALVLLGVAVHAGLRRRAARRDARAAEAEEALEPGRTMLHGRVASVDADEGEDAVQLEVHQVGVQRRNKNTHKVKWTEVDRRVTARPFEVELADGRRIRVEPRPDATRLVDELAKGEMTAKSQRVRRARLSVGETVYASGVLERAVDAEAGFRGQSMRLVLRPPASGKMLLSTRPLDEAYGWRMYKSITWAVLALMVAGAGAWLVHAPYLTARHAGFDVGTAVIAYKATEQHDDNTYYLVTVVVAETEQVFREALDPNVYQRIARGDRVPVMFHPDYPDYAQIGRRPAMFVGKVLESAVLIGVFFFFAAFMRRSGMPWYAREPLVEVVDGRMPDFPAEEG